MKLVLITQEGRTELEVAPNKGDTFTKKDFFNLQKFANKFKKDKDVIDCFVEEK